MSDGRELKGRFSSVAGRCTTNKTNSKTLGHFLSFENGEVDHMQLLSSQFGNLLKTQEHTDVTFIVEGKTIEAHRIILSGRCEYFRALLFGGMKEAKQGEQIELHDTPLRPFEHLLKYIYTGTISLKTLLEKDVIDLLVLANRYSLLALESAITGYLKDIIMLENVADIYDVAALFNMSDLENVCLTFMDQNASEVISSDGFLRLSGVAVLNIISRTSFLAPEFLIFKGVCSWVKNNDSALLANKLLHQVRLPLIGMNELLHSVRDSDLYSAEEILDAVTMKAECSANKMPYRGYLVEEENLAQHCYSANVLTGEMKENLLDGTNHAYDLEKGYTRHIIQDNDEGIIVELGQPSVINTIKLLLWDLDTRSYSYKIEHSIDKKAWNCLLDYSKCLCRSTQILHFDSVVTKFIKILGMHNSLNKCFHLVSFECCYSSSSLPFSDGFVVPNENVASVMAKAIVLDGVSRNRNALIDGDTRNFDWESGYTCHQIGSGCITIQLAQPFLIGSMRMLLWDCDDRSYNYFIQVSLDQNEWATVWDKREEACQSWQTITFSPRPISFVRITGTHNTSNEVFHVVHFECPAIENSSSSSSTAGSITDRDSEE